MDATVSARIPVEIRNQVHSKLKSEGKTPTQLINSAYQSYLKTGKFPNANDDASAPTRIISASEAKRFTEFLKRTSLPAPKEWEGKSFSDLRNEAMQDRYPEYLEA